MPRCLSEGVDIFLKSVERQGESGHDVRVSRSAPWMARVGDPVMMRTTVSLFIRKFTPGDATSRRDVPFAVGVRGFFANSQLFTILQQIQRLCDNSVGVAFFQFRTVTEAPEDTYGEGACRLAGLHVCGGVSHVDHFVCGETEPV